MSIEEAYRLLYAGALTVIAVLLAVMLVRSARGPGATDRLLSINMIGTLVIAAIMILALLLGEAWLLDVALIYTMISLVSVLILARVFIPPDPSRNRFREEDQPPAPAPAPQRRERRERRKKRRRREERHA